MKETIKKRKRKKGFSRVLSVFLAMVLCLSTVLGMPGLGLQVKAEEDADTVRFDITGPAFLKVGQAGLSKEAFTLKSTIRSGTEYTDQIYSLTGNVTKATITGDEVRYDAKIFIDMNYTLADTKVYYNGCYVQTLEKNGYVSSGLTITLSFNCKVDITSYDETTVLQTVYVPQKCNVPVPDTSVNPSLEGYTFCGWVTSDGVKYDFQSQVDTATLALYPLMLSNAVTYSWNEDNTQVTGYSNNLKESLGVFSETVEIDPVTYETVTASTCTTPGVGRYTSKAFVTPVFTPQTVDFELPLSPSTHKMVKRNQLDPTDDTNGYYTHWECTECHKRFMDSSGQVEYEDVYIPMLKCFTYADGVMTLRGYLDKSQISNFAYKNEVKTIVASEGTILPGDSSGLFMSFTNCTSIDLSNADTSLVTNMSSMFAECSNLENLNVSSFNTQKVTDMTGMFYGCKKLKSLDLSNFVTPTLTSVESMFNGCSELMTLDIRNLNTDESTTYFRMFDYCRRLCELTLGPGISKITYSACLPKTSAGWARGDVNGSNISGDDSKAVLNNSGTNTYYKKVFLSGTLSITKEDDSPITTPEPGMVLKAVVQNEVCDEQYLSYQWKRGDTAISNATSSTYTVTKSDVGKIISCVVTDQSGYYKGELTATTGTEVIQGSEVSFKNGVLTIGGVVDFSDIYYFDKKSSVTKIVASEGTILPQDSSSLFSGYGNCTEIDLSKADTSNVTNMSGMFMNCYSLESLNISKFNTEKVTDMSQMFSSCSKLTSLNLSNFVTPTLADTMDMFYDCSSLVSLDIRNLKTDANTSINNMFGACYQLRELTLGAGITNIPANVGLSQGNQGWARGSKTGNRISGDQYFAEFSNSGTHTYYLRSVLAGTIDLWNEYNNNNFIPMTGKKLEVVVSLNYGSDSDLSYQWKRGNTNISGATSSTYTPTKADIGSKITCVVKDKTGVYAGELKVTTKSAVIQGPEVSFKNGVLTIGGNVTADDIHNAAPKEKVKKIIANEGTVLPKDCVYLFSDYPNCTSIDLSNADGSNVTDMSCMFSYCSNLTEVKFGDFNTDHVTRMPNLFYLCSSIQELDLSSFNTKNAYIDGIFDGCSGLKKLTLGKNFTTITESAGLLTNRGCWRRGSETGEIVSEGGYYANFTNSGINTYYRVNNFIGSISIWDEQDECIFVPVTGKKLILNVNLEDCPTENLSFQWKRGDQNISKATSSTYTLTKEDIGYIISCVVKDKTGYYMNELVATIESEVLQGPEVSFKNGVLTIGGGISADDIHNAASKEKVKKIVASEGTVLPEECNFLFYEYSNCTTIDLSNADTSHVTSMYGMFCECSSLETLKIDHFDTSKVTDIRDMFAHCVKLTSLDLSSFNMKNVSLRSGMFYSADALQTLTLGDGFKGIQADDNLFNGNSGWAKGSATGKKISGADKDYAVFSNSGKNTYYKLKESFVATTNLVLYESWTYVETPVCGQTLFVNVFDCNVPSDRISLQWKRGNTEISGATDYTYTLVAADVGYKISCVVKEKTGAYVGEFVASLPNKVEKADGPAKPTGLKATAVSVQGGADGKITGVTKAMEYATSKDFKNAVKCTSTSITGLKAGTYYVRIAATGTTKAGAYTTVTVKDGAQVHTHGGENAIYHAAVAATCTKAGNNAYYECNCGKYFSDKACTKEIKKDSWVIAKKGHNYGEATYEWAADNSTVTAIKVCKNDASHTISEKVKTTSIVVTEATETKDGLKRYTATFTKSGFTTQTKDVTITKTSHKHGGTNAKFHKAVAATCEKAGNSAYYECNCGKYFSDKACTKEINKDSWVIKAKGHDYGEATYIWSEDKKSVTATKVCKNDASHSITEKVETTYEVIKKATQKEEGLGRYTATFKTEGFETQTTDVKIPKEKVTSKGDVTKVFTDVPSSEWYVNAVQFVYDNSIMNGTSDTTFAPKMVLNRGQFVTVLYNMEGRPETKYDASVFKDVKESDYFALPVMWAAANDITSGTGENKFSPNADITREQLAVMLYKYSKIKNYKTEYDKKALDSFPDKSSVSSWATEAMQWAVSNKVLGGKAGKNGNILDPGGKASRAECAQMIKNLTDYVVTSN